MKTEHYAYISNYLFSQVCGRTFNRKDNLREHLRAHAGQTKRKKRYVCEHCDKEFYGTTLLHIHRRTHTGIFYPPVTLICLC